MESRRLVQYFVPGYYLDRLSILVDDQSTVSNIIEHLHLAARPDVPVGPYSQVAYLPKDVALEFYPLGDLDDRFTAIISHLEYPSESDKIFSLDLCDEGDGIKVQFFVKVYSDQPQFMPYGEERDHSRIIQLASSSEWNRSSIPESPLAVADFYQTWPPLHNGRPTDFRAPRAPDPIIIHEGIFSNIVDDLSHLSDRVVDGDILARIGVLASEALSIYNSASGRAKVVGSLVEALLGWGVNLTDDAYPSEPLLSVSSNAFVQENRAIYLHVECRNELGLGGIPDFQGPLALLEHIAEPEYAAIRNNTCCPCIHVFIAGPYISFGGSILTDRYSYQPFTDYIYLGGLPLTNHLYNTARIFDVFQNALHKIRVKYMELQCFETSKDPSRLFPHPAYLPNTSIPNLVFEGRFIPSYRTLGRVTVPPPPRALFHAQYNGQRVVVKFCDRYHYDAHRIVAEQGLAPRVHFYTRLRGGMHMVIMDRIDGSDALDQFDGEYLPESVVKQVEAALAVLHSKNMVHGAIRRYNVLVKMEPNMNSETSDTAVGEKQWRVYLIGFERVGEANKDRYDIKSSMGRQEYGSTGAIPGGIMELVHDKRMYLHFASSWY